MSAAHGGSLAGAGATRGTSRFAAYAGLTGIALGAVGVLVDEMWTFPGTGASASEIASFVDAHRSALLIALILTAAGAALWLVFGAGVWVWMRETASGESLPSVCFLIGVVGFVTLLLAGFTSFFLLAYRAPEASDPRLLYDLTFSLLAMSGIPTALALGSYATHVFRHMQLLAWTAWVAVFAALAHLALLASLIVRSGFFSLEGGAIIAIPGTLFVWIACVSGSLAASPPQQA
jgi:hypothetical protein